MNPEKKVLEEKKIREQERALKDTREEKCTECMCRMMDNERKDGNEPIRMMLGNGGPEAFFKERCRSIINTADCPCVRTLRDGEKLETPHFSTLYVIGVMTRHDSHCRMTK